MIGKDKKALEAFYGSIFDWRSSPRMEGDSPVRTGGVGEIIAGFEDPEGHLIGLVQWPKIVRFQRQGFRVSV